MERYWVSAIVQNDGDTKPWLLSVYDSVSSLEEAMSMIAWFRHNNNTLSAWVDIFDENKVKHTVYHKCYIDICGNVKK